MNQTVVALVVKVLLVAGLIFYLYKDARARDYTWMMWAFMPIIIIFTPGIGGAIFAALLLFGVYLLSRPKGELVPCPHCKKKVHTILAFCPFCRQSVKKECLRCHDTVDWEADRCPHCGSTNLTKG